MTTLGPREKTRRLHQYISVQLNAHRLRLRMDQEEQLSSPLLQNANDRKIRGDFSPDLANNSWSFWVESKILWRIARVAIISRIATSGLTVITQAFVGHLSDLELAPFSLVISLIVGFDSGILVSMFL